MEQNEDTLNEQNDNKTDRQSPSPNNGYDYRKTSIESNASNKSYGKNEERRVSKQDKEVTNENFHV